MSGIEQTFRGWAAEGGDDKWQKKKNVETEWRVRQYLWQICRNTKNADVCERGVIHNSHAETRGTHMLDWAL